MDARRPGRPPRAGVGAVVQGGELGDAGGAAAVVGLVVVVVVGARIPTKVINFNLGVFFSFNPNFS